MPNRSRPRAPEQAILAARAFLANAQDDDGYWRDFDLEPGRSDSWVTGCVGCAIAFTCQDQSVQSAAIFKAAAALRESQRAGGWGYNRKTACDADSTSWVIRFLAHLGMMDATAAQTMLERYITPTGKVRTFQPPERFGSWSLENDEVGALAGLACLATGQDTFAKRIRTASLRAWQAGSGWPSFWWRGRAYAAAQNLTFLGISGGISDEIAEGERQHMAALPRPNTPFEAAQRLIAMICLHDMGGMRDYEDWLIEQQLGDGGWAASPALLVRSQRDASKFEICTDDRRLFSTAMALLALGTPINSEFRGLPAVA